MIKNDGNVPWRLRVLSVAVVGALVLVGCGGGGGKDESSDPLDVGTTVVDDETSGGTVVEVDDETDGEQKIVGGDPVSHLPFDGEAPAGYRMVPGECEANAEAFAAAKEAGDHVYASAIAFAVPDGWAHGSKGSAGSGGVTGTDVDFGFRTDVGEVEVAFEWDNRNSDNEILDGNGELWTSFDRESNYNGTIETIEYEQVASGVSVGDQSVDIFHRDLTEVLDRSEGEEYKARVLAFDLPYSPFMTANGFDEYSFVVTITLDGDSSGMDQGIIESIIESINLPACVWDDLLLDEEVTRQADLNGDGQVKTMEEWQAEMMAEIEAREDVANG